MPASQMHPYSIFVDRDRGTVHICAQGIGHCQYFSKAALHQLFSHTVRLRCTSHGQCEPQDLYEL